MEYIKVLVNEEKMELDDLILASETFIIQGNYTILNIFNSYFLINTIYRNIFYLIFIF